MAKTPGLLDLHFRYQSLTKAGDPLEKLGRLVDFEIFRPSFEEAMAFTRNAKKGGRPPYDAVLMMKILALQMLYNLSDDQTEFQIKDRLTFMRFLGLKLHDNVPDAKTIWLYRERLMSKGLMGTLFKTFDEALKDQGYLAMGGQIIDASIIKAPRPRMTKEEKETVKRGETPADWKQNPAKNRQKDKDARWTVKFTKGRPTTAKGKQLDLAIPEFGYKNHIGIDKKHGFIRTYAVTDAATHDGTQLEAVLDAENTASNVWADTAYRSRANEEMIESKGLRSQIHRKKPRGKAMAKATAKANSLKSKVRARVEHVFAHTKHHGKLVIRTIGLKRASVKIGLANLVYNMKRLLFFQQQKSPRVQSA